MEENFTNMRNTDEKQQFVSRLGLSTDVPVDGISLGPVVISDKGVLHAMRVTNERKVESSFD